MDVAVPNTSDCKARLHAEARRFGWAVVASSLLISSAAFAVYVDTPGLNLQPRVLGSAASYVKASGSHLSSDDDAAVHTVLDDFVAALAADDAARLRQLYPRMSRRDARVLHDVSARLGTPMTLTDLHLRNATHEMVEVDFAVVAREGAARTSFVARVNNTADGWRISELH